MLKITMLLTFICTATTNFLLAQCNCRNDTQRMTFSTPSQISVVCCMLKESSLGAQTVHWCIKNNSSDELEISFQKNYTLKCGNYKSSKAWLTLKPGQIEVGNNFSGDITLWDAFFKEDCEGKQKIASIGISNLQIKNITAEQRKEESEREEKQKKSEEEQFAEKHQEQYQKQQENLQARQLEIQNQKEKENEDKQKSIEQRLAKKKEEQKAMDEYGKNSMKEIEQLQKSGLGNKFQGNSWRIVMDFGAFEGISLPVYTVTSGADVNTYNSVDGFFTMGNSAGLEFYPYFGKNFGVGLISSGFFGYLPQSSNSYYLGFSAFLGSEHLKLLGEYKSGSRSTDYSLDVGSEFGLDIVGTGGGNYDYNAWGIGLRIGGYDDNSDIFDFILDNENSNYGNNILIYKLEYFNFGGGFHIVGEYSSSFPALAPVNLNQNGTYFDVSIRWMINFFGNPY